MSRIRADKFVDRAATGAPQLTYGAEVVTGYGITGAGGINITGVATANSFSGGWSGALSVTDTTDSTSTTTGALIVSGGVGIAKSLFVGNNVTIGGTVTYEDVTNVDSVGIITAQTGVKVTAGGVHITAGGLNVTAGLSTIKEATITDAVISVGATCGITTITTSKVLIGTGVTINNSNIVFNQTLMEKTNTAGGTLGSNTNLNTDKGQVYRCNGNESGSLTLNVRHNGTTALSSILGVGETITVTVILEPNNSGVIATFQIDGTAQTVQKSGGTWSAGSDGYDVYTFIICRTGTGNTDYLVIGTLSNHT